MTYYMHGCVFLYTFYPVSSSVNILCNHGYLSNLEIGIKGQEEQMEYWNIHRFNHQHHIVSRALWQVYPLKKQAFSILPVFPFYLFCLGAMPSHTHCFWGLELRPCSATVLAHVLPELLHTKQVFQPVSHLLGFLNLFILFQDLLSIRATVPNKYTKFCFLVVF